MQRRHRTRWLAAVPLLVFLAALPASAQIETNLSAYTGENARGYLMPLKDAAGAALNSGSFRSAWIPGNGFTLDVEVKAMVVRFGDSDKTFTATTEEGFLPRTRVEAPTVVGSTEGVPVTGPAGNRTYLPGGLDLKSLALAAPQVTIGSLYGTQAVGRWIAFDTGDTEIGNLSLWGAGLRHSVSQYLPNPPLDLAVGFLYQHLRLGKELIRAHALTVSAEASRRFPGGGTFSVEPYAGLSLDTFSMKTRYESDATAPPTKLDVDFGAKSGARVTGGIGLNLSVVHIYGEADLGSNTSYLVGLSLGS
jgi:hypothetical protein